jgi:hypothetical protein
VDNRPSETYYCQCKGCQNGTGSAFSAAPSEWYTVRGMTPPKNCPDCREWIKAQSDQAVRCTSCNRTMRLTARFKISHHKRVGRWEGMSECRACERGFRPPQSVGNFQSRQYTSTPREERLDDFSQIDHGISVVPRNVTANPAHYQHATPDGIETREVHILHHMSSSYLSQVGQYIRGRDRPQSASAYDDGTGNFNRSMMVAADSIYNATADNARTYQQGRRLVHLQLIEAGVYRGLIERTILEPGPNGAYRVVTTHDQISITDVIAQQHGQPG